MAWDIYFDKTWAQRIEKEENHFLRANLGPCGVASPKTSGHRGEDRTRRTPGASGPNSPSLSRAGSQAMGGRSRSASGAALPGSVTGASTRAQPPSRQPSSPGSAAGGVGSRSSGATAAMLLGGSGGSGANGAAERPQRSASTPNIPGPLAAVARFPVADRDMITGRVEADPKGMQPKIRMLPEKVKAMWWPGRGSYVRYQAEFSFEEPPSWTPDHILRPPPNR